MAFTDRHHALLITGAIRSGDVLDEVPTLNDEGWDGLKRTVFFLGETLTAEDVAARWPRGSRLSPTRNWWLTGVAPRQLGAGVWNVDLDYKGWAGTKPAKIRVGAAADQQSGQNVLAPAFVGDTVGATFAKVETHENAPTITVAYLVADITAASMTSKVGTAQEPPVAIAVPATVWSFLTLYVWHWPQGWVLMGSEEDRLAGCNAAMVTDSYKFIRAQTPG